MCECGCTQFNATYKFPGPKGVTYAIGVYPSCDYCCTPAGITVYRLSRKDTAAAFFLDELKGMSELQFFDSQACLPVIDPELLEKRLAKSLVGYKPENGTMDEFDAEACMEDAIKEHFRDCVFETLKRFEDCGKTPVTTNCQNVVRD